MNAVSNMSYLKVKPPLGIGGADPAWKRGSDGVKKPKNGSYVHGDGSLRHYKDGFLHNETGPSIDYEYTSDKKKMNWFKAVEYHLNGKSVENWDDPDPKVQELKKYKEVRETLLK